MHMMASLLNMSWVQAAGSAKQCARCVAHAELLPVVMPVCLADSAAWAANHPKMGEMGVWCC